MTENKNNQQKINKKITDHKSCASFSSALPHNFHFITVTLITYFFYSFFFLFVDGVGQEMDSLDLLSYLKEQGKIEESNLKCLNEALAVIGRRDLAKKVQEFENKYKNLTPGLYFFFNFRLKIN